MNKFSLSLTRSFPQYLSYNSGSELIADTVVVEVYFTLAVPTHEQTTVVCPLLPSPLLPNPLLPSPLLPNDRLRHSQTVKDPEEIEEWMLQISQFKQYLQEQLKRDPTLFESCREFLDK